MEDHLYPRPWQVPLQTGNQAVNYKLFTFSSLQVHALHHKSYNPTAFSGTNMHPVEATLYYSAALIPVALGLHPVRLSICEVLCKPVNPRRCTRWR